MSWQLPLWSRRWGERKRSPGAEHLLLNRPNVQPPKFAGARGVRGEVQTIAILDTFSLQMRHMFGLQLNTESRPRVRARGRASETVIMFEYGLLYSYPTSLSCPVLPCIRQAWQGARSPIVKLLRGHLGRLEKMQGGPCRE